MMEELREIIRKAKSCGLVAVVWSYPRGGKVTKETAFDIVAYAAHMAALMGANIIKVKPPSAELDLAAAKAGLRGRGHRPLDPRGAGPPRHAVLLRRQASRGVLRRRG